jgi:HPt (histidine-containing phosphotransfer) domain-containing protein
MTRNGRSVARSRERPDPTGDRAARPVDLAHLSRYTLGERALEREVLELFCAQSAIYLERLRGARSGKEWQEAAHSLKGSARAIGAWRAAAAAESAEALPAGDRARAAVLHDVEASLDEAKVYIHTVLKGR